MSDGAGPLHIAFASPAYWPAVSFGGPIWVLRELAGGLVDRGHTVDVFTSSLPALERRGAARTSSAGVDGARVHYLATPLRFRWMGFTPTLPRHVARNGRPDVAHVFGFRDPVGTLLAAWCRRNGVPYLFEALGMFRPKLRKVRLKRFLDATVLRAVVDGAALVVATSDVERRELLDGGVPAEKIAVRPNGFPSVADGVGRPGALRDRLALPPSAPLVLSVGRIARGKGLELLVRALRDLPAAHLAIVGPDGGHGLRDELLRMREALGLTRRVHLLEDERAEPPLDLYADADVFVLASRHENFGMVAAEAAAVGTPVVVTENAGISELLRDGGGLVVPYEEAAIRDAVARVLGDGELRRRLSAGARDVARAWSWAKVVERQEELYRRVLASEVSAASFSAPRRSEPASPRLLKERTPRAQR